MKHLRKFNTQTERDEFMANTPLPDYPYVHYLADSKSVIYSDAEVDIPFYIENIEGLSLKFGNKYEYSRDGVTWTSGTSSTVISYTTPGERVYFRASGLTASSSAGIGAFTISAGTCNIGGNLMSMLYGADYRGQTEITQDYAFYKMFDGETRIKSARFLALPATTLSTACYGYMFNGCTALEEAPKLPATTLSQACYSYMFQYCRELKEAPALPALDVAFNCYYYMFRGCTSLVNAPALPATTLANYCYYYMFQGCTSLVNAPALPATTLANYCYSNMFDGCTSLVNAPALPATTLANYCYSNMLDGCTSLVNAPALPATTLANYCYSNMFDGCTSLVNAPALPATTLANYCYYHMFRGCTSLVNAPALPATTISPNSYSYSYMFADCTSLGYIKAMCSGVQTSTVSYWVKGVVTEGTFVKRTGTSWSSGESGIPEGWTVETADA